MPGIRPFFFSTVGRCARQVKWSGAGLRRGGGGCVVSCDDVGAKRTAVGGLGSADVTLKGRGGGGRSSHAMRRLELGQGARYVDARFTSLSYL